MKKNAPQNKAAKQNNDGFIRVISGQFRGRKLPVKDVQGLRPTTDRIKETLFNWLMQDVRDANVLDCFAGSGGLGFESLSRYAKKTTFLELEPLAATQVAHNIVSLNVKNADLIQTNTLTYLGKKNDGEAFNLVFIDPPFRKDLAQTCCDLLENNQWLTPDAIVYVEVETDLSAFTPPANWLLIKDKKAGQVFCRLYQRQAN